METWLQGDSQESAPLVPAYLPMKVAKSITLEAVAKLFQGFGTVVVLDMQRCRSNGEVLVTFSESDSAERLLEKAEEIVKDLSESNDAALSEGPAGQETRSLDTGEVPEYIALLAPTPARLPTPFGHGASTEERSDSEILDFIPGRVVEGMDTRTSICVGGLSSSCSSERFLQVMQGYQLISKLRFFYLPVDDQSDAAIGYAFMDFQHPSDVLRFWDCLPLIAEQVGIMAIQNLCMSYTRIQGRDRLLQHFGGSDIMFCPDANKRPQFFFPQDDS
ncbi:unnamed protein product [Durusdinium trenchii]|uniref:Mei2-like C-terminal RNA recognition motif domain-containing protein n=1 Tax=Durusdinium trenchii TaxID=1381693 RepID=A0ABP0LGJ5_9DINO